MIDSENIPPELGELFGEAIGRHVAEEIDVLGNLATNPPAALAIFKRMGGSANLFVHPDTRRIYRAIDTKAADNDPRYEAAVESRRLLLAGGLWDDQIPACNRGMLWSNASLLSLWNQFFFTEPQVEHHARRLLAIHRKIRDAKESLQHARELLEPEPEKNWRDRIVRIGVAA